MTGFWLFNPMKHRVRHYGPENGEPGQFSLDCTKSTCLETRDRYPAGPLLNGDYILVKAPKEYPGKKYRGRYCYEHHLRFWEAHKILVKKGECIHHVNGNKHDNTVENLQLVTIAEHNKRHADGPTVHELLCYRCGNQFERESRLVNHKIKAGQKRFFCSRSCQISQQHEDKKV